MTFEDEYIYKELYSSKTEFVLDRHKNNQLPWRIASPKQFRCNVVLKGLHLINTKTFSYHLSRFFSLCLLKISQLIVNYKLTLFEFQSTAIDGRGAKISHEDSSFSGHDQENLHGFIRRFHEFNVQVHRPSITPISGNTYNLYRSIHE